MSLKFGTSGIRGLVTDFTDYEVYLLTTAFLKHACGDSTKTPVSTAMDLRESSPSLLKAAHQAICDYGCEVLSCGILPTPALAYFAQKKGTTCLMVTGSHIPADRNGIKFYLLTGETLKHDDEKIFSIYQLLKSQNFKKELFESNGKFKVAKTTKIRDCSAEALSLYKKRYTDFFPNKPLEGKKVLIYQHSSAARDLLPDILSDLGAKTINLGRSDIFIPVDTEAVESLDQFKKWISQYNADALVSTDGDGDRPLVIDNNGDMIQGDKLGMLCASHLGLTAVALPISCNTGISKMTLFKEIMFTKIGSPYVVDALNTLSKTHETVAGFEANGGFILQSDIVTSSRLDRLATRDAILPIVSLLAAAQKKNKSLAELTSALPARFTSSTLVRDCPLEKSEQILKMVSESPATILPEILNEDFHLLSTNQLDGVRMTTDKNEVVHFRPSGNAPEFRCYTESASQARADQLASNANTIIKKMIQS